MAMQTLHPSITTAEQLFNASDLGRGELIRGEFVMMSPAGSEHGRIIADLTAILRDFVKGKKLGLVFGAETGFLIERNPDTVRAPDVSFVGSARLPAKIPRGFFPGPPDLAVEVLSPSDRASEVLAKVYDWLASGCQAVWVVDPEKHSTTVYRGPQSFQVFSRTDILSDDAILPGLQIPLAEIFLD
jgi:Uma2 family endonuclease